MNFMSKYIYVYDDDWSFSKKIPIVKKIQPTLTCIRSSSSLRIHREWYQINIVWFVGVNHSNKQLSPF